MRFKTGDPISEYTCWGLKTLGEIYESEGELDSAAICYEITLEKKAELSIWYCRFSFS